MSIPGQGSPVSPEFVRNVHRTQPMKFNRSQLLTCEQCAQYHQVPQRLYEQHTIISNHNSGLPFRASLRYLHLLLPY
ncbi:hypothetical protein [Candidatus Lokiarchaeum ossiferum]